MSPSVSLVLSILSTLPQEVKAITRAYTSVKEVLATSDQATIGAILNALDTKTDGDVAQLDRDVDAARAAAA